MLWKFWKFTYKVLNLLRDFVDSEKWWKYVDRGSLSLSYRNSLNKVILG